MTDLTAKERRAFRHTRVTLRDLVSTPVTAFMALPHGPTRFAAYSTLTTVPLDLASAGFAVTLTQTGAGCSVLVERTVIENAVLSLHGESSSLAAALFQIGDQADLALMDLEAHVRRARIRDGPGMSPPPHAQAPLISMTSFIQEGLPHEH